MKPQVTELSLPVEHNDLRNHWGTGSRRGFAQAHRPLTLRVVAYRALVVVLFLLIFVAATAVEPWQLRAWAIEAGR